jgi:hypothetical protein
MSGNAYYVWARRRHDEAAARAGTEGRQGNALTRLTTSDSYVLEYAGPPDEGATEPPYVWVDLRGPVDSSPYPCLLDSGASSSAFPLPTTSSTYWAAISSCSSP